MTIRPARPDDRPELKRMRRALWPDSTDAEVDQVLGTAADEGVVLVAERSDGRLAGFAELALRKFADGCASSPVAYLEGLWTDPDARRSGVAEALVRAGEAWARSLGLSEVASDCELGNEASRLFHLAAGFEEVHRTINFRRSLGDG